MHWLWYCFPLLKINSPDSDYHDHNRHKTGLFPVLHFLQFAANHVPQTLNNANVNYKFSSPESETLTNSWVIRPATKILWVTKLILSLFSKPSSHFIRYTCFHSTAVSYLLYVMRLQTELLSRSFWYWLPDFIIISVIFLLPAEDCQFEYSVGYSSPLHFFSFSLC